jgi:competence protein ComEA
VADAIAAAGGVLPGALIEAINLAEPLTDGSQVIVPGPATAPDGTASATVPSGDGRIHLNRATAAELDDLPGIGPVIAERIVAHRSEHGPFRAVEDLLDVPGIGEAKLANLRDLVVP